MQKSKQIVFAAFSAALLCAQVLFASVLPPASDEKIGSSRLFVAAYESEDGHRAFVLANATANEQSVRCVWPGGKTMEFQLEPRELRLTKENSGQSTSKRKDSGK